MEFSPRKRKLKRKYELMNGDLRKMIKEITGVEAKM